jgi:hypothetical protein
MSRRFAVSAGLVLSALLGAVTPAFADQVAVPPPPDPVVVPVDPQGLVIAVDPDPVAAPVPEPEPEPITIVQPEPYPEPYSDPVAPPRESPRSSTFVYGAASQVNVSGRTGIDPAGWGGTVGLGHLERHGEQPTGVDVSGTFLTGDSVSIYDLSVRIVASPKINSRVLVPYVAIGICAGASRIITDRDRMSGRHVDFGLGIGPSASLGVHGYVGNSEYWRLGAGFLGAGVGAVTADLAVGMVVD